MISKNIARAGVTFLAGCIATGAALTATQASAKHEGWEERPRVFSERDFKGTYGWLETGTAFGLELLEVAVADADGAGNMTITYAATVGGAQSFTGTVTCTYSVQPNGMGELACIDDGTGDETGGDFVLTDGGREVKIISKPNAEGTQTVVARRQ